MAISTPVPSRMASMSSWRMPVVMKLPSPPPPHEGGKDRGADGVDRGDADAGEDDGGGQGEFHMEQAVHPGHAHAPWPASMRYSGTWLRPRWVLRTMGSRE